MTLDIFPKPRRKAEPAPVETTGEEPQAELPEPSAEAMAESESPIARRTRRGTRGGRRKDESAEDAETTASGETPTEVVAEAPAEEAPAKPVRRTRRTKAQIEAEAAAAAEAEAAAAAAEIIESAVAGEVPAIVVEEAATDEVAAAAEPTEAEAVAEAPIDEETVDEETAEAVAAAHVEDEFEEDPSESQVAVLGPNGEEPRRSRDRRRGGRGRDRDRTGDRPDRERREPGIAASDFAQESGPAAREPRQDDRDRQPREPREPREPRQPRDGAPGGSTSQDPLVRAIENQNRQIGELLRAIQDDRSRRATSPNGAPPPRLGVFVDVANIELAADRQRVRLDWGRILGLLSQGRQLVRAVAYAPIHDDPSVSVETQRFVEPFLEKGFKIVTKPLKRFQDGSIKANVDIELALDVVAMTERLDVVCLVSGDGDFEKLVELVQGKGVRVEVVSFGSSTAGNLKQAADSFIDLQSRLRDVRI